MSRREVVVLGMCVSCVVIGCSSDPEPEVEFDVGVSADASGPDAPDASGDAGEREDAGHTVDAGASEDAGGGAELETCYADDRFTCVEVGSEGYGVHEFDVPAIQNWVNSGLFLKEGERALVSATGEWRTGGGFGEAISHGECLTGDAVARIGLHYEDATLTCVHGVTEVVAQRSGILYVGMLPSNDLGETYESRYGAAGVKRFTVEAASPRAPTVPTVSRDFVETYDYDAIASGWVEVAGEHLVLTIPSSLASQDRQILGAALDRLDAIYRLHEELRGGRPHSGQRIRVFPDGNNPGWMLAGNPIRTQLDLIDASRGDRITNAGAPEAQADVWGITHELGHDFSFIGGKWTYQTYLSLESWPNVFSVYALERLGIPLHGATAQCTPETTGSYVDPSGEPWGGDVWRCLCFLRQISFEFGWPAFTDFFATLDRMSNGNVSSQAWERQWPFLYETIAQNLGDDPDAVSKLGALFDAWQVPR